ncbi:MAG: BNR-4 repeat-containing protein [Clostridia bacterium]|nr:BNR-4 repeat-containing protein [Clostridia bacterium]
MIDLKNSVIKKIKRANTDWWINEKAIVAANGLTYIAYVTDMGEIHLKEMDAKCSKTPSRDVRLCTLNCNYADEHNAPSVCITESGKIIVAYTGHNVHGIHYRITEKPYDIFSFGPEKTLCYDGSVTYAQLYENTVKNELWFFCRVSSVTWQFRYSADEGLSWSEPVKFLESDQGGLFYLNVRKQYLNTPEKEQFFFALYGHPRASQDHNIRSGIFRADGTLLKTDGSETPLNLYRGGLIRLDQLDTVYASPEGTTVRLLEVSPTLPLRVGFAPFVLDCPEAPDPEKPCYRSATFRDGTWNISDPICKAGEFLSRNIPDGSQTYLGGMAYYYGVGEAGIWKNKIGIAPVYTNRIFIARFDGECRVLESYLSHDNGKSYALEQVLRRIPEKEGKKIWRPVVPIHAQDNMPVYWHEGEYGSHTGGWHSDAVMLIEYDD